MSAMSLAERARLAAKTAPPKKNIADEFKTRYSKIHEQVAALVLEGWIQKVENAADRGHITTDLFSFQVTNRFYEGKVIEATEETGKKGDALLYLAMGKKDESLYWQKLGVKPFIQIVKEEVMKPEHDCYLTWKWVGGNKGYVVAVCWDAEKSLAEFEWHEETAQVVRRKFTPRYPGKYHASAHLQVRKIEKRGESPEKIKPVGPVKTSGFETSSDEEQ
jgi:hypothetical protein